MFTKYRRVRKRNTVTQCIAYASGGPQISHLPASVRIVVIDNLAGSHTAKQYYEDERKH